VDYQNGNKCSRKSTLRAKLLSHIERKKGDSHFWSGLIEVKKIVLERGRFKVQDGTCRGSLPPVLNFYRSCVGLGCLAQETMGFILVRASEE
jgi:hypothetical protein